MAKPNENWQERVYEAYTSNVKLDINNPQEGLSGPIVYNWMASTKSGEQSSVGMTEGGIYHIYNDQCIEIIGGQKQRVEFVLILLVQKGMFVSQQ